MKKNSRSVFDPGREKQINQMNIRQTQKKAGRQKQNRKGSGKNSWPLLILVLLLLVVFLLLQLPQIGNQMETTTQSHAGTTETSSTVMPSPTTSKNITPTPLLTPTPEPTPAVLSAQQRQNSLQAAADEVTALLTTYDQGRFAVFFKNMPGGETWGYNDVDPFVAASSIKVGLNTLLYTGIESGDISPEDILTYDNRSYPTGDYEPGTGTIQNLPHGSRLTVRETSGLSIRISDNSGTNMIIRHLGGIDAVNIWLQSISGAVDYRQRVSYTNYAGQQMDGRHRTCARDLALHTTELYRLWQNNPAVYDPLIDDLSNTTFDFGINKGIPDDIQVAHKIGTNPLYATENDVGIVFSEEPYILCIMTEMESASEARKIQAEIAAIFYRHVGQWPWS